MPIRPRRKADNLLFNGDFEFSPGNTPMTSGAGRWIDGTAGGSITDDTYGWYAITGVGSLAYSFDDTYSRSGGASLKLDLTNAAGRGRSPSAPFESTTTRALIQKYGIPILPSTSYKLEGYIASLNAISGVGRFILQQYSADGVLLNSNNSALLAGGNNNWTLCPLTITTSANAAYAVIICHANTAGQLQTYWFDDITFAPTAGLNRILETVGRTVTELRTRVRDFGTALKFNGGTDKVVVPGILAGFTGKSFSVGITVKAPLITNNTGAGSVFLIGNGSGFSGVGTSYFYIKLRNYAIHARCQVNGGSDVTVTTPQIPNRYIDIIATYNVTDNRIRLYVDGVFKGSAAGSGFGTLYADDLKIGGGQDTALIGLIDEPRLWEDVALSDAEVASMHFNNSVRREGLIGEFLLNEGSGTQALNSVNNGYDGTITGATYTLDVPCIERTRAS